jgi:integrase
MPRLIHKPPAYSLHRASGQAKVRHGGKDHYLGAYGSDESKRRYAEFIASLPKPDEPAPPARPLPGADLAVSQLIWHYYEHAREYYVKDGVPTGEHMTVRAALRPLKKLFGDLPAREFGPKRLKLVREEMIKLGWSRRYINKCVGIIKRCFLWCASEEMVDSSVAISLKTVSGLQRGRTAAREKPTVQPVSDDAIEAVLPHVSDLVADTLRVMRLTSARPGEVLGMLAEGIDRSDSECWRYEIRDHKTVHHDGKTRTIFLGPKAQEVILPRILKAGNEGRLFPMDRTSLRRAVHRGCKRAGIPNWHPNRIRHSVGTEVRSKFGLEAAQCLLGHSRADVTQTYAERDERRAAEVARKIG